MKKLMRITGVWVVSIGLLAAAQVRANCAYDIVGNTQLSPTVALTPDGQVTYGMESWWEDDVMACYNAFRQPAYLPYFAGCDRDNSGLVEFEEVLEMYEFVIAYPTDGVPAFAYECPVICCPADIPGFYDPSGSEIEWVASGVCATTLEPDGPPACTEDQFQEVRAAIDYILDAYPVTGAVFDHVSGAGQVFYRDPYTVFCFANEAFPDGSFDELNDCYHGSTRLMGDGLFAMIDFDWGINVPLLEQIYGQAAAAYPGGACEMQQVIGGIAYGFRAHVESGWTLHEVTATEDCDYYGCRCLAELGVWTNGDGEYYENSLENLSSCIDGTCCTDPRFGFWRQPTSSVTARSSRTTRVHASSSQFH